PEEESREIIAVEIQEEPHQQNVVLRKKQTKTINPAVESRWKSIEDLKITETFSQPELNSPTTTLDRNLSDEEIFFSILDEEFWEYLVKETNQYYKKVLEKSKTKQHLEDHKKARIANFK